MTEDDEFQFKLSTNSFVLLIITMSHSFTSSAVSRYISSYWSKDALSYFVCGLCTISILFLVSCVIFILWKIYSEEDSNSTCRNEAIQIELRQWNNKSPNVPTRYSTSANIIAYKSNVKVPYNTPVGSVDV